MEVKFMYNGIKIDGKLIKGSWSKGGYRNGALFGFYADGYYCPELRKIFAVKNDTDLMTDYHDKEKIYFFTGDKNLENVKAAWQKQEIRYINRNKYYTQLEKEEKINKILAA